MKSLMLAMIVICSGAITPYAEAQFKKQFEGKIKGQFWVVGNRATNACDIVTSNPIIEIDATSGRRRSIPVPGRRQALPID